MALTAEQQTQATQLTNGLPWVYPGLDNASFWDDYFSQSGPSLTPDEQASGISIGPMAAPPMPTPAPAPQPQVLPQVGQRTASASSGQVPYQSELIRSLREASPGFTSNNPGVTMLANPANSKTVIDFQRAPPFPAYQPFTPPPPSASPAPAPSPSPRPPSGGSRPPSVQPPSVRPPSFPQELLNPDQFVGPVPDISVGPTPAETFPVPDPGEITITDLDPLEPVAESFPVPDPSPWEPVDLPPIDELKPSVEVVQDLPITTEPIPRTDPAEDFEIDRELGLVPEWDVFESPFLELDWGDDALFGDFQGGGGGGGSFDPFKQISLK